MERDQDIIQRSIDELTEWQENQYNPGFYMGGRVPNNLLSAKKPWIVKAGAALIGLSFLAVIIFSLVASQ
jgi:hypothetical protein